MRAYASRKPADDRAYRGWPVVLVPVDVFSSEELGFSTTGYGRLAAASRASCTDATTNVAGTRMPSECARAIVWLLSNARSTASCAGSTSLPPARSTRSRIRDKGNVVRSVIGSTRGRSSRATCRRTASTNASLFSLGEGYWKVAVEARDQPAFDHGVVAPTVTR